MVWWCSDQFPFSSIHSFILVYHGYGGTDNSVSS